VSQAIEITVNGMKESVPEHATLADLIARFEEKDIHLIVERNGRFVYPQEYGSTVVAPGDVVEFINPNFGG
jgi:thiamine biosynthesis protein ThiS